MESHTPSGSEPKSKRIYKRGLSEWQIAAIDGALDSGLKVMNYDGELQPRIFMLDTAQWWKPPFQDVAGREVFVQIPEIEDTNGLHFRLESMYVQIKGPRDGDGELTLLFYMPLPKNLSALRQWIDDLTLNRYAAKFYPIAEGIEPSLEFWSDPVQVKLENGELVFRKLLEATGDDFDHWAGRKFWEVERGSV